MRRLHLRISNQVRHNIGAVLWVTTIVVGIIMFNIQSSQIDQTKKADQKTYNQLKEDDAAKLRQVNLLSYNRCLDRNINITKANEFYATMASLERTNRFIDATLREQRVALYESMVFAPADCGAKP